MKELQVRGSNTSLFILQAAVSVPLIICVLAALKHPSMWIPVILLSLVSMGLWVWIKSFTVEINDGVLRYSSLFGRDKKIEIQNIQEARIEIGCLKYTDRFRPTVRLVIKPKAGSSMGTFYINIQPLERKGVEQLLDALPTGNR